MLRQKLALACLLLVSVFERSALAQIDDTPLAQDKIRRFLTNERMKEVLTWLYPVPLKYQSSECPTFERRQGKTFFYHCLISWRIGLDGHYVTALAFQFDRNGTFERTELEEHSLAFQLSTLVLKQLANVFIESNRSKLTTQQLEFLYSRVDAAETQSIMDFTLRIEQ